MVLKVYGFHLSTCTRRVITVCFEKQIPYELIDINLMKGEHKDPSTGLLEKQPFGMVPYIDDEGFILFESRAICRYLALKYASQGTKLIPDANNLQAIALFEQGASIETSNFDAYAEPAVSESLFKKHRGLTADPEMFKRLIEQLDEKLKAYEVILGRKKYVGGDDFSLVDIFHLSYGWPLERAGSDIMSRQGPNVTRWWKEITSRPSWLAAKDTIPLKSEY